MDYKSKVEIALQKLSAEILEHNERGRRPLSSISEGLGEITIKLQQLHTEMGKDNPAIDLLLTEIAAIYVRIQIETHY